MSQGMFRTVSRLHSGYAPDEVDAFFGHARGVYEGSVDASLTGRHGRPAR